MDKRAGELPLLRRQRSRKLLDSLKYLSLLLLFIPALPPINGLEKFGIVKRDSLNVSDNSTATYYNAIGSTGSVTADVNGSTTTLNGDGGGTISTFNSTSINNNNNSTTISDKPSNGTSTSNNTTASSNDTSITNSTDTNKTKIDNGTNVTNGTNTKNISNGNSTSIINGTNANSVSSNDTNIGNNSTNVTNGTTVNSTTNNNTSITNRTNTNDTTIYNGTSITNGTNTKNTTSNNSSNVTNGTNANSATSNDTNIGNSANTNGTTMYNGTSITNGTNTKNTTSSNSTNVTNGTTANSTTSNSTGITNSTNTNGTWSRDNTTSPQFLVVFRIKSAWPVDRSALAKDIASAFDYMSLTQKYINITVHVTNMTCLWSCPRSKRSLNNPRPANYETETFGNNTVIIFVPTYGNGTTPSRLTTRTTFVYNVFNAAQGRIIEPSAVLVVFAVFQGRIGQRFPVNAATVTEIFKLYGSFDLLNQRLTTVDEVLSFPIPLSEFLAATEPPPAPPSPSSTLLIPSWAIFLLVFVSFLILLFIIWIVYSCTTGTLKEGGASLLVSDLKKNQKPAKGPMSHPYNIHLHKHGAKQNAPTPVAKTTARAIRFDRSTSYDVGLLSNGELDNEATLGASSYKRKESHVQEAAVKRKINQKKQMNSETETSFLPTYKPKFTRLNGPDKIASSRFTDIQEKEPPSEDDRGHTNFFSEHESDLSDYDMKKRRRRKKEPIVKLNESSSNNEAPASDPGHAGDLYYPKSITPYPIFQPLHVPPYHVPAMLAGYPHQFTNPQLFYPNATLHLPPHSILSASRDGSLRPARSMTGDEDEEELEKARSERFRKMARDLLEDAFDDSGLSSFSNRKFSSDKPTDMEEFRKVLDEAFPFSKPISSRGSST